MRILTSVTIFHTFMYVPAESACFVELSSFLLKKKAFMLLVIRYLD